LVNTQDENFKFGECNPSCTAINENPEKIVRNKYSTIPRINQPTGSEIHFTPAARYPDPTIEILDPSFQTLRLFNSNVEQLITGLTWAEGPVWFGDGRYLLVSDIPNNRIIKWDETTGVSSVFRSPSHYSNGLSRDQQGRLLTCEHETRRLTRTEYNGSITVLASHFGSYRFNSPNDVAVNPSDGSIWFTDPNFGLHNPYEGGSISSTSETDEGVYRLDANNKIVKRVISDLKGPNGLAFSRDGKLLYVVECGASPFRKIWVYQVNAEGELHNKTLFLDAQEPAALDGLAVDSQGNIWTSWGSTGESGLEHARMDGVRVFNSQGKALGHIHLPEICGNVCFGGLKMNRLFMASSHSVYAVYVNTFGW
jgi:gluconolactonase